MTDGLHAAAEDVSANEIDVEGLVASAGTGVDRLRAVAWQGRDGAWGYRLRELIGPGLSRCRVRLSRVGDPTR